VAVSSVGENRLEFKIDTSDRDIKHVHEILQSEFGSTLRTYSMTYGPVSSVESSTVESQSGEANTAAAAPNTLASANTHAVTDEAAGSPSSETPAADRAATGSMVALTFPQEISYAPLAEMIQRELDATHLSGTAFELANPKYHVGSDAPFGQWTLRTTLTSDQTESLVHGIQKDLASTPVFPSSNQIGGKVAGDTQLMALYAILASMAIIVVYVWLRFENVIFGLAAVLALFHDLLVTIALLALSYYLSPYFGFLLVDPFKISLAVMAALLTIVGFSINDKIVVFDRIREVRGKRRELDEAIVNASINQALSRTILTSGTVFIASIILYFLGGPGIHAFAFAMTVGVIAGTYSSIYIAAPVLLWIKRRSEPVPNSKALVTSLSATR
jgi:SecD/SecF fusion protein